MPVSKTSESLFEKRLPGPAGPLSEGTVSRVQPQRTGGVAGSQRERISRFCFDI